MNTTTESSDPFAATRASLDDPSETPIDWQALVNEHPVAAILAAAAAGAGAIALLSLAPPHRPPPTPRSVAGRAASELESLRDQISELAQRLLAKAPVEREVPSKVSDVGHQVSELVKRLMTKAPDERDVSRKAAEVGDSIRSTWQDVRGQATGLAERLRPQLSEIAGRVRPQVDAATHLAKDNPLWVGVVVGAIGALLASHFVDRSRY